MGPVASESAVDLMAPRAKVGPLTLENDFFRGAFTKVELLRVKETIAPVHALPLKCRAAQPNISRGTANHRPEPVCEVELPLN